MPKTSRTSRWAVCAATLLVLGVTALFLEIGSVFAIPSMQTAFIAKYPELRETQLNSCTTCHMPAKKDFLNNYAIALKEAKMDFATIMDEVVQQFTAKLGVDVTISVEIEAKSNAGFDEGLQRTVKENCNVLRFSNAEFEEE